MDPEDADYVCTLDAASIKKAKLELNEDPADRLAAVKAFRDWIKAQSHIHYPDTSTQTLLIFLRSAKFSQIRARAMLEGNLSLKQVAPDWFCDIDSHDKNFLAIVNAGYIVPLPKRTKDGCSVLMYRIGAVKANQFPYCDLVRAGMLVGGYIMKEEMTQVNGTEFIFDFTGVTAAHITAMMNRKDMAKWQKFWQKNVPGRFKGFHYYNAGMFFETLITFGKPFMPKKFLERIHCHDTAESLYKYIPEEVLPEELLPDEYTGSNGGSLQQMIETFKTAVLKTEFRDFFLSRTGKDFWIDLDRKPQETINTHFRKLTVD